MIIWNSLKLFPHIHGYLFIFANTEMYSLLRVLLYVRIYIHIHTGIYTIYHKIHTCKCTFQYNFNKLKAKFICQK